MSDGYSPGDVLLGKFEVERVLGQGGMGVVVAARHLELRQRVALKFLLPSFGDHPEAAERFRREARAAARLKSEHVVRVLDVGTLDGDRPFMVMEYLEGHDLGHEIASRGPLPPMELVDFVLQAIEAVAEAHSRGIVHRDLTPANLFLSRRTDGTRVVKVLDFGISKTRSAADDAPHLTRTATMMGSPLYMAPEQMVSPSGVDERADLWSLGAILYHGLAGRPPHFAETLPLLCAMVLERPTEPLLTHRPELPPALAGVVMRCLEKDRERRYASVAQLAEALAPFGPADATALAERASRVLGGVPSDVPTSPQAPLSEVPVRPGTDDTRRSAPHPLVSPSAPPALAAATTGAREMGGTTAGTWGRTEHRARRHAWRWSLVGVGLLVTLLAVTALVSTRSGTEHTVTAALPPHAAEPPGMVFPTTPTATAAPVVVAPEAMTPAPVNSAEPSPSRPQPALAPAAPRPPLARPQPVGALSSPRSPAPASTAAALPGDGRPASTSGIQISDFGGRR